jgi:hypothetical protein
LPHDAAGSFVIGRLPGLVPTAGVDEPAEVWQTAALEVEHTNRRVGAVGVFLEQQMPAVAVGATEFIAGLKSSLVHRCDRERHSRQAWSMAISLRLKAGAFQGLDQELNLCGLRVVHVRALSKHAVPTVGDDSLEGLDERE